MNYLYLSFLQNVDNGKDVKIIYSPMAKKKYINMYFATHSSCNMNCRYCYVPKPDGAAEVSDRQILDSLKSFIEKVEIENYVIGSFCFHGTEPTLMSPGTLAEAANLVYGHWNNEGINNQRVSIQTNGWNPDREYLLELEKEIGYAGKLSLSFSIDPPKAVHDKYRNKSYDRVMANFVEAIALGFRVSVLAVVTPDTINNFPEFAEWMKYWLRESAISGNPYKIKIKPATGEKGLYGYDMERLADLLAEYQLHNLAQILTPGYCIQSGNECMWFEFDINGNCYSCNKAYNENGKFADWYNESFDEIFSKRKKLYMNNLMSDECSECEYEFICNSGCPLDRHYAGSLAGKAHECLLVKKTLGALEAKGLHIVEFYNNNI